MVQRQWYHARDSLQLFSYRSWRSRLAPAI